MAGGPSKELLAEIASRPGRDTLISSIVTPRDVVGALGLMSVAFNTAQVIGPAIAALLIEWVGEGPVFVMNGFAYSAVVLAAHDPPRPPGCQRRPYPPRANSG